MYIYIYIHIHTYIYIYMFSNPLITQLEVWGWGLWEIGLQGSEVRKV